MSGWCYMQEMWQIDFPLKLYPNSFTVKMIGRMYTEKR